MINSEKIIFMKREGQEWIMYGLFVDDMIHAVTNDNMRDQFIREYKADFNITLEDVAERSAARACLVHHALLVVKHTA